MKPAAPLNSLPQSFVVDSTARRDKSLWIFLGALAGAAGGAYLYKQDLKKNGDEDFAPYASIPLYVGSGAILGGFVGFLAASVRD